MKSNFINIVLYQPEIPQNTGNIARMCVANDLKLHLIKPLGFEISDKYLKRSALDYWEYLNYSIYDSWFDFFEQHRQASARMFFFSTKAKQLYWDIEFRTADFLVFGPETQGLPKEILEQYQSQLALLPMSSSNSRSLNLASTVQTAYYEAYRQLA